MLRFKEISLLLIIITFLLCFVRCEEYDQIEEFIPTTEWQVVKPNQKIPPGLHIRSNLQTGVTEAKILDKSEKTAENSLSLSKSSENDKKESKLEPNEMKKLLKNIKNELKQNNTSQNEPNVSKKFRTYEEIKKDFDQLNLNVKTDLEIIRELMDELKNKPSDTRIITILTDLEYYLHQIDNAQNFVDMNGLELLHMYLENSNNEIQSATLMCLASCFQSNPKVKIKAIKSGSLTKLIELANSPSSKSLHSRLIGGFSTLLRQFPIAQNAFFNGGGFNSIGYIYDQSAADKNYNVLLKIVTLLSDLSKERKPDSYEGMTDTEERLKQYSKVDLSKHLVENDWCSRIEELISDAYTNHHVDFFEKMSLALTNTKDACSKHISSSAIELFVTSAKHNINEFQKSMEESDDELFVSDMMKLFDEVKRSYKVNSKSEL